MVYEFVNDIPAGFPSRNTRSELTKLGRQACTTDEDQDVVLGQRRRDIARLCDRSKRVIEIC